MHMSTPSLLTTLPSHHISSPSSSTSFCFAASFCLACSSLLHLVPIQFSIFPLSPTFVGLLCFFLSSAASPHCPPSPPITHRDRCRSCYARYQHPPGSSRKSIRAPDSQAYPACLRSVPSSQREPARVIQPSPPSFFSFPETRPLSLFQVVRSHQPPREAAHRKKPENSTTRTQ